ncbi:MAG TPA: DUF2812 domain-containing protein [Tissierellia bacterium]|nr:DUF2812 domain-containing protein [Tissierellia bacterium]
MNKLRYRFQLSDLWELGKNESWFEHMASKGLHIKSIGKWLVTFEKGEPQNTRYRIDILYQPPTQEQLDVYKECGWELTTNKDIFYIFSSPENSNAPELHTDPMEQGFTFDLLNKEIKKNTIIFSIAAILVLSILFYVFFFDKEPYLNLIRRSSFNLIAMAIGYTYVLFASIRSFIAVKRIKNSLYNGIPINHKQSWKLSYFFSSTVYISLIVMVLASILTPFYTAIKREGYISKERLQDFPIPTIEEVENTKILDYYHDIQYNWSILAPIQYTIYEDGYVEGIMQEDFSGAYSQASLHIRYYELTFKSMAEGLVNDLIHRYYREYRYDWYTLDNEDMNNVFDQLYVGGRENTKLIFASSGNKVIYFKYPFTAAAAFAPAVLPKIVISATAFPPILLAP